MSPEPLAVRSDLTDVEPYLSPQQPARYRMNTNESPYPPPRQVIEGIEAGLRDQELNRYPDRDATELHAAVADRHGVPPDSVWVANGSNEVFLHLLLAYGGPERVALTFEPTYSLHTLIPRITGTRVVQESRTSFAIEPDRAREAFARERPDIVMTCSPNNPSGLCDAREVTRSLLEMDPGLVIVDEAYIEFAHDGASVLDLISDHDNLVVTRTFSKAWSIAGVRLGYLVAQPRVINDLLRVRLPYHLSSLSQAAGLAVLRNQEAMSEPIASLKESRDRIIAALAEMGIVVHPSDANFVLFQVPDAHDVWEQLREQGVLIRDYSRAPGLEGHLRVSAGTPEETDAFLQAIAEVVNG